MVDFKYEIVEHIGTLSESAKDGQRNLTRFHGMVENQIMLNYCIILKMSEHIY